MFGPYSRITFLAVSFGCHIFYRQKKELESLVWMSEGGVPKGISIRNFKIFQDNDNYDCFNDINNAMLFKHPSSKFNFYSFSRI